MRKHIIKYEYCNGVKLAKHEIETWCGYAPQFSDWLFLDAQHALLSIEQGSLQVLRIPMIPVSDSADFDRASRAGYFLL
ncbi:hypothetical protein LWT90_21835 [Enterobacter hormaechei]|nr:hypothetical protein [Enterobacter hormaechei]